MNHYATRENFERLKSALFSEQDDTLDTEDNNTQVGITNGEKLMEVFPDIELQDEMSESDFIRFTFDHVVGNAVERRWWDAPYMKEEVNNADSN